MARPRSVYRLFPSQFAALRSESAELLVLSASPGIPAGASHLLRMVAIKACSACPGTAVVLATRSETDIRKNHRDGPSGFRVLVSQMVKDGFASISEDEIRFENGSTVRWFGCSRETEVAKLLDQRVDVLLVDGADEFPEAVYSQLRERVLVSPRPVRRTVVAAKSPSEGWVSRHWPSAISVPGRDRFALDPGEMDPEMIARPPVPSYRDWIDRLYGGQWAWPMHVEAFVDAINRWVWGEWEHLAIHVPSQHGKTTAGPRNAIPYILDAVAPSDWCSIASYQTDIANSRSADAKEIYLRAGGELRPGRKKVKEWQTAGGGGCWSAGTAAGQTGRSATWSFIDDGDKDWADAVNGTQQKKKRRWYGSVYRARESMFAAEKRRQKLCVTATRWDPEDLAGYALRQGIAAGETWAILVLSAIYDPKILDGYRAMYPGFVVIDDFRKEPGEPLWEARRTAVDWKAVFILRGPLIADCECQQAPRGVEKGGQFLADWFRRLDRDPAWAGSATNEEVYSVSSRAWDLASTEAGGDYTAGVKMGRVAESGQIIVRHAVRAQYAPVGVNHLIAAMMLVDGPDVSIRLPIDPAAGGEARADELVRYLRKIAGWVGMPVPKIVCERPRRGASATLSAKAARAHDLRSLAEPPAKDIPGGVAYVGEVWAPSPSNLLPGFAEAMIAQPELREIALKAALAGLDWWTPWLREMEGFTGVEGRTDDQVDATVDAYDEMNVPVTVVSGASVSVPGWG